MGDAFIVRRGGGAGLSKCSIIVHIDSGSTVAAYSNAEATTKVKDGKEIGTSGDYLITGLNTGTYYVKATKNGESTISGAITFSEYGIEDVVLSYALIIWKNGDGIASFRSKFSDVYGGTSSYLNAAGNVVVTLPTYEGNQSTMASVSSINITGYSTLEVKVKKTGSSGATFFGIAQSRNSEGSFIARYNFTSGAESVLTERRISIPSTTTTCYVSFFGSNSAELEIEYIRFVR